MPCFPSAYLLSNAVSLQRFQTRFDRSPFAFTHQIQFSEHFSYDALLRLARRVSSKPNRWYVEEGDTLPENSWSNVSGRHTLLECLEEIAFSHSLVMLKRVNEEPEYKEILDHLEEELSRLTGIDIFSQYFDPLMDRLDHFPTAHHSLSY